MSCLNYGITDLLKETVMHGGMLGFHSAVRKGGTYIDVNDPFVL